MKVGDLVTYRHIESSDDGLDLQEKYFGIILALSTRWAIVRWLRHPVFIAVDDGERGERKENLRLISSGNE